MAKKPEKPEKPKDDDGVEKVRYLVKSQDANFVIELPATWKITFANVNPAASGSYDRGLHCLRVYDGTKLRAVYGNVSGVRDLSIPTAREVKKETGSSQWTTDSEGSFDRQEHVARQTEFQIEAGDDPFKD